MVSIHKVSLQIVLTFIAILSCLSFASVVSAQEDSLSATIRAAIASDAEYENLSQEEIDAIVAQLANEAQLEGMTAEDITWRPQPTTFSETAPADEDTCGRIPRIICQFSEALGFRGDNIFVPSFLLLLIMAVILLTAAMIEHHRHHHHPISQDSNSIPPPQYPPVGGQGGSVPPPSY